MPSDEVGHDHVCNRCVREAFLLANFDRGCRRIQKPAQGLDSVLLAAPCQTRDSRHPHHTRVFRTAQLSPSSRAELTTETPSLRSPRQEVAWPLPFLMGDTHVSSQGRTVGGCRSTGAAKDKHDRRWIGQQESKRRRSTLECLRPCAESPEASRHAGSTICFDGVAVTDCSGLSQRSSIPSFRGMAVNAVLLSPIRSSRQGAVRCPAGHYRRSCGGRVRFRRYSPLLPSPPPWTPSARPSPLRSPR